MEDLVSIVYNDLTVVKGLDPGNRRNKRLAMTLGNSGLREQRSGSPRGDRNAEDAC
jgi:hypothetical protein